MKYTRIYTGTDNQSHFEDGDVELFDALIGKVTAQIPANCLYFGEITDEAEISWHNPSAPQFVIMLEGAMEIEIGDGAKRIFNTGDIVLAEDTTGQGHVTRAASLGKRRYMVIPLADGSVTL
ncbi:MAG: hypothetical protein ACHQAX_04315 [Gammaproteobacteria bacterium]